MTVLIPTRSAERAGVHRAGPAERDEREPPGSNTALDGHSAHCLGHRRIDDRHDAVRGDTRALERRPSSVDVEHSQAGQLAPRCDVAERQIGICHRRLGAATAVARRPGIGAR